MQQDAKLACFLFKADYKQLQALCDKYLNNPMGPDGPYRYLPLLPYAPLVYADMKVFSLNESDRNVGWMREVDLSFWVLTVGLKRVGKLYLPDHVAFFLPYLFVNNSYAIATGREVFGFQKTEGFFKTPPDIQHPEFSVDSLAFKTLSPDTEGVIQPLLRMEKVAGSQAADPAETWADRSQAGRAILRLLTGNEAGEVALEGLADKISLFDHLNINVPIVFLKQFRDIADTEKAAYQAIVKAPATLTEFHGGGLLLDRYQLVLNDLQSHPIAKTLGLQTEQGRIEAIAAAWLHIDFPMQEGVELWRAKPRPQKIAILGGGMGSLATALALTEQPGWQANYEITICQMGWRLGGKGASGRDPATGMRVEEHGLHLWFGWYDNAFRLIQRCYAELARPSDAPLATWDQALQPHNFFVLQEFIGDQWVSWPFSMPANDQVPGQGHSSRTIWSYVQDLIAGMHKIFSDHPIAQPVPAKEDLGRRLLDLVDTALEDIGLDLFADLAGPDKVYAKLRHLHQLAQSVDSARSHPDPDTHTSIVSILKTLIDDLHELQEDIDDFSLDPRRLLLVIELGAANAIGILEDGVLTEGFAVIDNLDYREWLRKWGASDQVIYSAPVRMIYDLAFAYPHGDTGDHEPSHAGDMAAGTLVHSALLLLLGYKGAMAWKMQAGMGETIFGPIYQVLKARGVKFEFFTKVTDLAPNPNTGTIDEIAVDQQVLLKPGLTEYNPLINVGGLPCWPTDPLYAQLERGDELKQQAINLESYWTPWRPSRSKVLKKGQDFDLVVLGISIGALPTICPKLTDPLLNPKSYQQWRDMLSHVKTVQTQAMQLWLKPPLVSLGWRAASPLLGSYVQPFSTWADMAQTLPREKWPAGHAPQDVAYLCGPLKDPPIIPPFSDHGFPAQEQERVRQTAVAWLKQNAGRLWPWAIANGEFNWDVLEDLDEGAGEARFAAQNWRANIDPTERYVLSVKGSSRYRLKTDESGLANLYLVGDWIDNGYLNAGSIEPAAISGLQASRAISGYPEQISGASIL
jgi:uncharacterized protein with NAD-binding domain and iron-sulfur cluster